MLTVEDLVVAHGSIQAVQGVSLALSRGEIVARIGPNGAGKTSLVRAIAGLHRPARGRVSLDGSELTGVAAERIVRLGAVLVPEGRMIFGTLTVRENLMIGAYTRRNASEVVSDVARI